MKKRLYIAFWLVLGLVLLFFLHSPVDKSVKAANSLPTLEDFWNGQAFFEFKNKFAFPTEGGDQWAWLGANWGTDLVVKDGTWYIFTREFLLRSQKPSYCPGDVARIVVRQSTDRGRTWGNRTVIIEPSEGKPYECNATDGDAYFDSQTSTWHYLFQCMKRDNRWHVCHATKQGNNPLGRFDDNPANPVIKNGDLWKRICDTSSDDCYNIAKGSPLGYVGDEGTPEIIEKRDDAFYVTFHGYDGLNGYRGITRTRDFLNWELVNSDAIFDKNDCQVWNVPWKNPGCIGGGEATVLKDSGFYYMLIEAADTNLFCTENQNWVFGLLRSPNLEATKWENMADNQSAIIFNSQEKQANGNTVPCGVQYGRLFKDSDKQIYLLVSRMGAKHDFDSVTGIYLYQLKKSSPFALYKFKEGPKHIYTNSDIISRGNFEAQTSNVQWINGILDGTYSLDFNGINSYVEMPDNPLFNLKEAFSLKIRLLINQLPASGSALITGKIGSYWLELYKDGGLCIWVNEKTTGQNKNTCTNISSDVGQWHEYLASLDGSSLTLLKDGVWVNSTLITKGGIAQSPERFMVGRSSPNPQGWYGSFNGSVDDLEIFNFAQWGDFNHDGKINGKDIIILLSRYGTNDPEADLNGDGVVNGVDFGKMIKSIR